MKVDVPLGGEKIRSFLGSTALLAAQNDARISIHFGTDRIDKIWIHADSDSTIPADHHGNISRVGDMALGVLFWHPDIEKYIFLIGVHQFIGTVWIDPLYAHESPSLLTVEMASRPVGARA
jgi:hypothetical protein